MALNVSDVFKKVEIRVVGVAQRDKAAEAVMRRKQLMKGWSGQKRKEKKRRHRKEGKKER